MSDEASFVAGACIDVAGGRQAVSGPVCALPAPPRSNRFPHLPVLVLAVLFATGVMVYLGLLLFDDRCLDAGGRVVVSGLDRVCELADGSHLPGTPTTLFGRTIGFGLWLALVSAVYWGMSRYVRSGRYWRPGR